MFTLNKITRLPAHSKGAVLAFGLLAGTSLWSADFSFTTGNPDGLMGAVSRRASPGKLETETADDFTLDQTTVIRRATIVGLAPGSANTRTRHSWQETGVAEKRRHSRIEDRQGNGSHPVIRAPSSAPEGGRGSPDFPWKVAALA
jgi:hypothetical protein